MRFYLFFVLVAQFPFVILNAQDNISESFILSSRNLSFHNPSLLSRNSDIAGNIAYRSFLGNFSVIRTYFADVDYSIVKPKKGTRGRMRQAIGLGLYNDREGEFFSKVRLIAKYAIHVPLTREIFFSGGAMFHLINYNFNVSSGGASGSAWTWSPGIGLSLFSENFCLGASFNDLNSPKIAPVAFEFSIPRYAMFYGEKKFSLSYQINLKTAARYSLNSQIRNGGFFELGMDLPQNFYVSALYYNLRGYGASVALNKVRVNNALADISIAYLAPGKDVVPAVSEYEINFRFYLKNE
ncbi:MAG: type IX secretion system membrane protein PorP/SprF [Cytophagales bacterium]